MKRAAEQLRAAFLATQPAPGMTELNPDGVLSFDQACAAYRAHVEAVKAATPTGCVPRVKFHAPTKSRSFRETSTAGRSFWVLRSANVAAAVVDAKSGETVPL